MYKRQVQNYYHIPTIPGSLSQNPVNAIYEDTSGVLWVGTVEGGLNRRAPGSNTFEHYTTCLLYTSTPVPPGWKK